VGVLRVACGCRIDLSELDALTREKRPMVVVANHPSLLDAVLVVSRLPNAVCIMKGAVAHNAFLGAGAQLAGYVPNVSALSVVRGALQDLKRHQSQLVIFPEGTRTTDPAISPCGATAGVIAARAGVPVQTLVITMSERYLGKGWPLFRPPPLPLHIRVQVTQRFMVVPAFSDEFGRDLEAWYRARLRGQPSPAMRSLVSVDGPGDGA
jgi:1-acyl-sn-glycerol-3-phosphate acyltransferase